MSTYGRAGVPSRKTIRVSCCANVAAMTSAETQGTVLQALSDTLQSTTGAQEVLVFGDVSERHFGSPESQPTVLFPPKCERALEVEQIEWFARRRQIRDLSRCRTPAAASLCGHSEGSLIATPCRRKNGRLMVVLCWHPEPGFFDLLGYITGIILAPGLSLE